MSAYNQLMIIGQMLSECAHGNTAQQTVAVRIYRGEIQYLFVNIGLNVQGT